MASRETENNAYAKFWGDKQRALWYVMVFLEWSIVLGEQHGEEVTSCESNLILLNLKYPHNKKRLVKICSKHNSKN